MNENISNVVNALNITKNQSSDGKNMYNSLDEFAKKLRMEKYDINELRKIKQEAALNEKIRMKKKNSAIKMQAILRGFLFRKKFQLYMEYLNKNIIIEYFRNKRKERIKKNYLQIIQRCLNNYIARRRRKRRDLLMRYYNFCSEQITRYFKGFVVRKRIKFISEKIRKSKKTLERYINSFKIRMILRTKKLQDYLNNIVDIKSLLVNLESENRVSEKSEKLKFELLDKLPKAFSNFYSDFYRMKIKNNWVKIARIKETWANSYLSKLKNSGLFNKNETVIRPINFKISKNNFYVEKKIYRDTLDISDIEDLNENPNIRNKDIYFGNVNSKALQSSDSKKDQADLKSPFISKEDFYKSKNLNNFKYKEIGEFVSPNKLIGELPHYSNNFQQKKSTGTNNEYIDNLYSNEIYNENSPNNIKETSNISMLNNSNINNGINLPETNLINLNNSNSNITSNIQSSTNLQYRKPLSKDYIQKELIKAGNPANPKSQTDINNLSKYNFSSENFYKPKNNLSSYNNNNVFYSTHQESFVSKNLNNPHDEKPIKANPNVFNEFKHDKDFVNSNNNQNNNIEVLNSQENLEDGNPENFKASKKIVNKDARLRRKTPKYDARKAIENAKSKDKKVLTNNFFKDENIKQEKLPNENLKNLSALNEEEEESNAKNELAKLETKMKSGKKENELLQRINSPEFLSNVQEVKMPAYAANSRSSQMRRLQSISGFNNNSENDLSNLKEEESVNLEKTLRTDKMDEEKKEAEKLNALKAKSHKVVHSHKKPKNEESAAHQHSNKINLKVDLSEDFKNGDNKNLDIKAMKSPNNKNKIKKDLDDFNINNKNHSNVLTKDGINVTEDADGNPSQNNNLNKNAKKRRIEINDKRRKIIEMEKSPHLKVDVTKVKSKIDCRGNSKAPTTQDFNTANAKKFKRVDDFVSEEKRNFAESQNIQKVNVNANLLPNASLKFNSNHSNNFINKDNQASNSSRVKQPLDSGHLKDLENQYNKINNFSNLHNFLGVRNEELKYRKIPFIKENSFYIKHYSDDIYDQLLMYLRKHYEELKN